MDRRRSGAAEAMVFLPALLALALSGVPADAQVLAGTVLDAATGAPVRGAVTMLLSARRDTIARRLTTTTGAFQLPAASEGRLRVVRIGYLPYEVDVTRIGTATVRVVLNPIGRRLPAVAVRAGPLCPKRADQAEALALWSAATDGLLAMLVATTAAEQHDSVTQVLYDRLLDRDGRRVVRQKVERVLTGNVTPIRADRNPEDFVTDGYVVRSTSSTTLYGPDPGTLLDSTFAATHCLSIRNDTRNHAGETGVAFAPSRNRDTIPDIAGVLWMGRAPLSLNSLEFRYRGVDQAIMDFEAGGRLDFETLENGVPIIHSWNLRTPELTYLPSGRRADRRLTIVGDLASVIAMHEGGGLIASGRLADGTSWSAPLAALTGRVLNSTSGEPVPGATVTLDSTDYRAMTDGSGRFAVPGVLPGPYVARVRDSVAVLTLMPDTAASLSSDPTVQQVVTREATARVEAGLSRTEPIDIRLPWREPIPGCGGGDASQPRFTVIGFVLTPDSIPLSFSRIQLAWADSARSGTSATTVAAETDAVGFFRVCGIVGGRDLNAVVRSGFGTVYTGRSVVPIMDKDERGRNRESNLRKITIVVDAVRREQPS